MPCLRHLITSQDREDTLFHFVNQTIRQLSHTSLEYDQTIEVAFTYFQDSQVSGATHEFVMKEWHHCKNYTIAVGDVKVCIAGHLAPVVWNAFPNVTPTNVYFGSVPHEENDRLDGNFKDVGMSEKTWAEEWME